MWDKEGWRHGWEPNQHVDCPWVEAMLWAQEGRLADPTPGIEDITLESRIPITFGFEIRRGFSS